MGLVSRLSPAVPSAGACQIEINRIWARVRIFIKTRESLPVIGCSLLTSLMEIKQLVSSRWKKGDYSEPARRQ